VGEQTDVRQTGGHGAFDQARAVVNIPSLTGRLNVSNSQHPMLSIILMRNPLLPSCGGVHPEAGVLAHALLLSSETRVRLQHTTGSHGRGDCLMSDLPVVSACLYFSVK